MDAKKVAVLGVAALMLFYVIVNPTEAACTVQELLGMLEDAANGLFQFVDRFFDTA